MLPLSTLWIAEKLYRSCELLRTLWPTSLLCIRSTTWYGRTAVQLYELVPLEILHDDWPASMQRPAAASAAAAGVCILFLFNKAKHSPLCA
jgi:hypothetical protein